MVLARAIEGAVEKEVLEAKLLEQAGEGEGEGLTVVLPIGSRGLGGWRLHVVACRWRWKECWRWHW